MSPSRCRMAARIFGLRKTELSATDSETLKQTRSRVIDPPDTELSATHPETPSPRQPRRELANSGSPLEPRLPMLCLVTDLNVVGGSASRLVTAVQSAVAGGVNMVQVRWRDAAIDRYNALLEQIADTVAGNALVIANLADRQVDDLAHAAIDGYHLPESRAEELPTIRAAISEGMILGVSVHAATTARDVTTSAPDYLMLGTLFPTASHADARPAGTSLVAEVACQTSAPTIGIGGITADNGSDVIRAGASGVAVIRAVLGEADPRAAAGRLHGRVQSAWESARGG